MAEFSEARVMLPHVYQSNFYEPTVPLCHDAMGECVLAAR